MRCVAATANTGKSQSQKLCLYIIIAKMLIYILYNIILKEGFIISQNSQLDQVSFGYYVLNPTLTISRYYYHIKKATLQVSSITIVKII